MRYPLLISLLLWTTLSITFGQVDTIMVYESFYPGNTPSSPLIHNNEIIYGATADGGIEEMGLIYAFDLEGNNFTNIYEFSSTKGVEDNPAFMAISGNYIYSVSNGGVHGFGRVFRIDIETKEFETIFDLEDDGGFMKHLLVEDTTIYLSTAKYWLSLSIEGTAVQKFTSPLNFIPLVKLDNSLFGISSFNLSNSEYLIRFDIEKQYYDTLYFFEKGTDFWEPKRNLIIEGNTLYGLTEASGDNNSLGCIYKMNTSGENAEILFTHKNRMCSWGLILQNGRLYSTGGYEVFSISTKGSDYQEYASFEKQSPLCFSMLLLADNYLYYGIRNWMNPSSYNPIYLRAILDDVSDSRSDHAHITSVYPNPTSGKFNIKGIQPGQMLEIYSSDGKRIMSCYSHSDQIIDLSYHPNGIYFIVVARKDLLKLILE